MNLSHEPVAFIADVMCGRLARWLRLLGYDVLYRRDYVDIEIARISAREGRVVLTRDRELSARRIVSRAVLVPDTDLGGQLQHVLAELGLEPAPERWSTRCPLCNDLLRETSAEAAALRVPPFALRTSTRFASCPRCDRVYWQGTHDSHARAQRERLLGRSAGPAEGR